MRGWPDENRAAFDSWEAILQEKGHRVANPHRISDGLERENEGNFIRRCFNLDCQKICLWADAVFAMPGWRESRGSRAEVALAEAIGLPVYEDIECLKNETNGLSRCAETA